jgi:hypothetical protein
MAFARRAREPDRSGRQRVSFRPNTEMGVRPSAPLEALPIRAKLLGWTHCGLPLHRGTGRLEERRKGRQWQRSRNPRPHRPELARRDSAARARNRGLARATERELSTGLAQGLTTCGELGAATHGRGRNSPPQRRKVNERPVNERLVNERPVNERLTPPHGKIPRLRRAALRECAHARPSFSSGDVQRGSQERKSQRAPKWTGMQAALPRDRIRRFGPPAPRGAYTRTRTRSAGPP